MYRVIGRERIYRGRYGKYMVEYSTPWPPEAHRLYLVGNFYSWLPGHLKLKREGKRGRVLLKLWEGEYYYLFCKDCEEYLTDPENEERLKVSLPLAFRGEASVSKVGVKELSKALKEGGLHGEYVIHDERDEAFLSKYLGNLAIRIKVLKGEWDDVSIEYVTREGRNKVSLDKVLSTEFFDYYEAIIPYSSIIRYRFLLSEGGRLYYYGKGGLSDPNYIEPKGIKGLEEKVWYLGTIYYLIFVDSFENGDPNNDPQIKISRLAPREAGYYGGDLKGIIRRLNYLTELGVEALYLTPVFEALSYHRYDVINYFKVDKYLGSIRELRELVVKAKKAGLRVILDVPLHHSSPCFKAFKEALREGPSSRYWRWYNFLVNGLNEIPKEALKGLTELINGNEVTLRLKLKMAIKPFYEAFAGIWSMPRFNFDNLEVVSFFEKVLSYWLKEGISGFRLDVSHAIPRSPLLSLYSEVKKVRSDAVIIGEVFEGVANYMSEGTYDSVMNYELRRAILDFFVYDALKASEFVRSVMKQYLYLPPYQANSLYNLLGSHDTPRIVTLARGDKRKVVQAFAFLLLSYGSPSIYYGDEIGLEGGMDPDSRRPMVWESKEWDKCLLGVVKSLIKLRKGSEALRYGFFRLVPLGPRALTLRRWLGEERVAAIFNASDSEMRMKGEVRKALIITYGGISEVSGGKIIIGPRGTLVTVEL